MTRVPATSRARVVVERRMVRAKRVFFAQGREDSESRLWAWERMDSRRARVACRRERVLSLSWAV